MYKQAIVVRKDLKMSSGKTAAQVAHASVGSLKNTSSNVRESWEREGAKKVVLRVSDKAELLEIKQKAKKLPTSLVKDAGMTELPPGTMTCLGIGPALDEEIDKVTGSLKLLE
jgi:PTH2 family peptidyl-tRNA hydrolase